MIKTNKIKTVKSSSLEQFTYLKETRSVEERVHVLADVQFFDFSGIFVMLCGRVFWSGGVDILRKYFKMITF